MKKIIETYGTQELSSEELKSINGGYDIIEWIIYGIGYSKSTYDEFWENNNSGGYVGSKM
ncbi:MAG: hypothetical protein ABFS35_01455 [Bacteroidota bacterium]